MFDCVPLHFPGYVYVSGCLHLCTCVNLCLEMCLSVTVCASVSACYVREGCSEKPLQVVARYSAHLWNLTLGHGSL